MLPEERRLLEEIREQNRLILEALGVRQDAAQEREPEPRPRSFEARKRQALDRSAANRQKREKRDRKARR